MLRSLGSDFGISYSVHSSLQLEKRMAPKKPLRKGLLFSLMAQVGRI